MVNAMFKRIGSALDEKYVEGEGSATSAFPIYIYLTPPPNFSGT
jgi:hypothetical protein